MESRSGFCIRKMRFLGVEKLSRDVVCGRGKGDCDDVHKGNGKMKNGDQE